MVGGTVTEVILVEEKGRIWIDCEDKGTKCAIYVEDSPAARCVERGDTVWWGSTYAFWSPKRVNIRNGPTDVKLKRVGFSGVKRPAV